MSHVTIDAKGVIGIITLDHAAKRNALSKPLVDEVMAALQDFGRRRLRVVILRAAPGARVFSAGHDVDELPEGRRDPLGWDDPLRYLIREIENFPAPVIAMIEGSVWGGACEAVFACDLIIAAPGATFAVTPAKLGVPYNISGMLTFLNAASPRIAKEMAFTARPMTAARLEHLGMINHVVALADLETFTLELANGVAANSPLSISVRIAFIWWWSAYRRAMFKLSIASSKKYVWLLVLIKTMYLMTRVCNAAGSVLRCLPNACRIFHPTTFELLRPLQFALPKMPMCLWPRPKKFSNITSVLLVAKKKRVRFTAV